MPSTKPAIRSMQQIIIVISVLFLGYSCGSPGQSGHHEAQFVNSKGQPFIMKHTPERVISCSPAITEIMFALHEEHKLAGRTSYCYYPPQVEYIPSIGGLVDPSLETILQLKPDLVMASTHFKKEAARRIEELGIPFAWLLSQESVSGAGDLILNVGHLIGAEAKADSLWQLIQKDIAHTVSLISANTNKPTVYYAVGFGKGGDYTAGGDTFISELITLAGGDNIASDVKGWSYNLETLLRKDPDIILIQESMLQAFCEHDQYKHLRAVKNHQVYAIDHRLVQINGPRIHIALRAFAQFFYPGVDFGLPLATF